MVSRAAPRKRRRVDDDGGNERYEPSDKSNQDKTSANRRNLRPRSSASVIPASQPDDDELPVSVATPCAVSESSEVLVPSSGETIGPGPEANYEFTAGPSHDELHREETVRSVAAPPLSGYDLDRLNYHVDLQDFGASLQKATNAVFSSDRRSKYNQVSALLLSWEDEDPQLPVSIEIKDLKDVFVNMYGFEVDEWQIPAVSSHGALNMKVLRFLEDSNPKHLKIVYYAGHGKLSNHGQAMWTSHRNKSRDRPPTVKWSGIQNALEESESDVLILLDCCASGLSNTDEGNGVTELLAACAFNSIANGVGPYSFTHALSSQLRKLARMPSFAVGHLYNLIFTEIQNLRIEDAQRKKAPIHLVLTQDRRLPRSIRISAKPPSPHLNSSSVPSISGRTPMVRNAWNNEVYPAPPDAGSSQSSERSNSIFSPDMNDDGSSSSSISELPEYPRLLFSIRISENIKPNELSPELFADWLGTLPLAAKSVRVEAGFASDSTLLMVSMPIALLGYLPDDPAVTMLGTTRSANLIPSVDQRTIIPQTMTTKPHEHLEDLRDTQDSGFEEPSVLSEDFESMSPQVLERTKTIWAKGGLPSRCQSCNRGESLEWRRGPDGRRALCNRCGLHYAKTERMGLSQAPKSGSPLRQSMSIPSEDLNSPTVRKTLFESPNTHLPVERDRITLLEKELDEKDRLIGEVRFDLKNAVSSWNPAPPESFSDSNFVVGPLVGSPKKEFSEPIPGSQTFSTCQTSHLHCNADENTKYTPGKAVPHWTDVENGVSSTVKQEDDKTQELSGLLPWSDLMANSTNSKAGESTMSRNVSACNRCRSNKLRCDQKLPSCASCERSNSRCVGYDILTKKEIPRSYIVFLENRVSYLEERLEDHKITFAPPDALGKNDRLGPPEGYGMAESLIKAPPISNQFLNTYGLNNSNSPLTSPESALSNVDGVTPWSRQDLPEIILPPGNANNSAETRRSSTPANSAREVPLEQRHRWANRLS